MVHSTIARTVNAVANTLAPRFRCSECRMVKPKTVFDMPEADGSYCCTDCERVLRGWHIDANLSLLTDGYDR